MSDNHNKLVFTRFPDLNKPALKAIVRDSSPIPVTLKWRLGYYHRA
jgi:hypothetical protein